MHYTEDGRVILTKREARKARKAQRGGVKLQNDGTTLAGHVRDPKRRTKLLQQQAAQRAAQGTEAVPVPPIVWDPPVRATVGALRDACARAREGQPVLLNCADKGVHVLNYADRAYQLQGPAFAGTYNSLTAVRTAVFGCLRTIQFRQETE